MKMNICRCGVGRKAKIAVGKIKFAQTARKNQI